MWDTSGPGGYRVLARPVSAATRARDVPAVSSRLRAETPPAASHSPSRAGRRCCAGSREGVPCERQRSRPDAGGGLRRPPRPGSRGRADRPGPRASVTAARRWSSCSPPRASASSTPSTTPSSTPSTDEELRGFYRDLVLIRRFDAEATALQRQGELGLWASLLGQEAAQVGSGRALRPQDYAFPTYREHGVAWCRGVDPVNLLGMFRGVNHGGWDPNEKNFHLYTIVIGAQTLHATGYAMGVQRDGSVGTGDDDRDTAVIAYFGDGATSQGDVNEAFVFAARQQRPGRVLLPEQPVGHLRAEREADPRPALPARPRLRLPRHPGRRQRRARRLRRHQGGARRRPLRPGPDLHRGLHLPDGRAHHLRRPDQVPRLRRGRGVEAPRPDRAAQAPTSTTSGKADARLLRRRRAARPTSWRAQVREGCLAMPDPRRHRRCSTTSTPSRTRSSTRERRRVRAPTRPRSRRRH